MPDSRRALRPSAGNETLGRHQENANSEAILRGSIAGIPGARLYREEVDQNKETDLHSCSEALSASEDDDQAQLDKPFGVRWDNVTTSADVDLLNSWSLLEKCNVPESAHTASTPLEEPSITLHRDGLPATHTCKNCEHVLIKPSALKNTERLLVARLREELDRAAEDGCPLLTWLRWYLYDCFANPPSYSSEIFVHFGSERHNDKFLGAIKGEFIDWGANQKGRKGKGDFGPFNIVTPEGKIQ